jgi:hypothetical protein
MNNTLRNLLHTRLDEMINRLDFDGANAVGDFCELTIASINSKDNLESTYTEEVLTLFTADPCIDIEGAEDLVMEGRTRNTRTYTWDIQAQRQTIVIQHVADYYDDGTIDTETAAYDKPHIYISK